MKQRQKKHNRDCSCEECSKIEKSLKRSPINYFSDLFIVAMVLMWIVDNVYQSLIASAVTISSIVLSFQTGMSVYDTSMWSSIGVNVAIPLSCGGAIWMIKNSVQHAIAYSKGKRAHEDFPKADVENYEVESTETSVEITEVIDDNTPEIDSGESFK